MPRKIIVNQMIIVMQKTFLNTTTSFRMVWWLLVILFFFVACNSKHVPPESELDLNEKVVKNFHNFFNEKSADNLQNPFYRPKPVFDADLPGSEVILSFEDATPRVVFHFKIDENGNQTPEQIGVSEYYPNQQERLGGGLKDGQRNGQWYAFFPDGTVQTDAFYVNGKEHGPYVVYRDNGKPFYQGHFNNGNCDGTWYWYDEAGQQTRMVVADKKTIACDYCKKCISLKTKNKN